MNTSAPKPDLDKTQIPGQAVAQQNPPLPTADYTTVPAPVSPGSGQQGKEYEPGQSLTEYASLPGSELEPNVTPELKDAGVEVSPNTERPVLTVEDKRLGVTHGVDALSHPLTLGSNQLPMTKEKAKAILEDRKIGWLDSLKGFALNMFRQNEKKEAQE